MKPGFDPIGGYRFSLALIAITTALAGASGCTEANAEPRDVERSGTALRPSETIAAAQSAPIAATEVTAVVASTPEEPTLTISAVGDCTLGDPAGTERAPGSFHKVFVENGEDLARPFSGVQTVLGADDLTIANLEGTLTTANAREGTAFSFRGKPEFAKMLSLGSVDIVNLANNHSYDCGPRGLSDTRESLRAANIGYFGVGDIDTRIVKGIEVHNLGYTGGKLDVRDEMAKAVRKLKRDDNLVIVSFHWGNEGSHESSDVQQTLGRAAIQAGADLVLGHHPHVLQGIEEYQGKKIVYSLGNFVFGGNGHPDDLDSMIFQAKFTKKAGKVVPLGYEVVPVSFSGHKSQNDFRPVLLEGADAARVRSDVEKYSALFGGAKLTD
ncbi:MAG: CapA family protein [Polyangiaceae bacterium]|nr:CapA family protein [Polyangiaceae bacterium]